MTRHFPESFCKSALAPNPQVGHMMNSTSTHALSCFSLNVIDLRRKRPVKRGYVFLNVSGVNESKSDLNVVSFTSSYSLLIDNRRSRRNGFEPFIYVVSETVIKPLETSSVSEWSITAEKTW